VEAALERRMRYISLPEWLKEHVLRARRPVVVTGTHGKTTTTALTAHLLARAGLDPGFLIGGQPVDFEHSARLGPEGGPFVIEGDEYDTAFFDKRAKFFHYLPEVAVVTSLEFDHADIYRDLAEIERAFRWMLRQVPASGRLVACADNHAASLAGHAFCPVRTYGFAETADYRGERLGARDGFQRLRVHRDGAPWLEVEAPLAGVHNLQNTLAALAVGDVLGAEPGALRVGLRAFRGVRRRMEVFHEADGVVFIDDFAHHPTAIAGTIAAALERWPGRRLRVLCEPRSNTLVTNRFQEELASAFSGAPELWLGPIHRADAIDPADRLDRDGLAATLNERGVDAHATDDVPGLVDHLRDTARPGDVVLVLSNGAFHGIYDRLRDAFPA
jgi:UDP-N-acetylmuramate: L-alanyl-gamma-D-glutamyl-meso-diaminopimelate ligase